MCTLPSSCAKPAVAPWTIAAGCFPDSRKWSHLPGPLFFVPPNTLECTLPAILVGDGSSQRARGTHDVRGLGPYGRSPTKNLSLSGCNPEFMKDALHGASQVQVVAIDGLRVLSSVGWGDLLSGGEERFDGFVAKHEQSGDRPQTGREGLIATGRTDPTDDLFTAELLQIVGCLAGTVGGWASIAERADLIGECGGGEAVG